MLLKEWDQLPEFLQTDEIYPYYEALRKKRFSLCIKRLFDIMLSLILLILLSPLFIVIAILIKLDSKGPVFYRQKRITQYGREFRIFKFRTMVENADRTGALVTGSKDARITRIGKKIRRCRLDETIQLLNVLKGEMSFVGVRPEVPKYVNMYTEEMKATLLLPAGITSATSIAFKNEDQLLDQYKEKMHTDDIYIQIILPEKMKSNLCYLKNFSILYDIKLCIKTVFI